LEEGKQTLLHAVEFAICVISNDSQKHNTECAYKSESMDIEDEAYGSSKNGSVAQRIFLKFK
jgi:hypothetical protein